MTPTIKIENLSKQYRLGLTGTGTLSHDLNRWWHVVRGKEDPYIKIGDVNDRRTKGISDYVWALNDINFEVQQGEVLGIIGKNGAGKSTLLKILSKVTAPTTGSISYKGRIGALLEVGTGFHPELTGRENIFVNGAILGMKKKEIYRKFDEIVDFSGCERYIDTPVKRYSSGMMVRLGFAVAAFLEPEILVVDEVLAVGDAEFQKKAIGKMQDVSRKEGRTVLFVSHNMAAVQNLCNAAIILKNGFIELEKTKTSKAIDFYLKDKKQNSQQKLSDRKDRTGEQNIKISGFAFLNEDSGIITTPFSGQYLKVNIDFVYCGKEALNNVAIAFSITRTDGFLISVFTNELTSQLFTVHNSGSFICTWGKIPLMSGQYYVNIMINRGPIIEDWITEAVFFDVEEGDFYNTGKSIENTHRGILFEQKWDLYE